MRLAPEGSMMQYGGHFASGGFSVSNEKIHHLDDFLNEGFKKLAQSDVVTEAKYIDMELRLEDVSWKSYGEVEKLAPFGTGNKKPLFIFKNIKIEGIKEFGKEKNHLELGFKKENGSVVNAMGFFMDGGTFKNKDGEKLKVGDVIDLVATMEKSMFRGRAELRLRIEEVV
jgi:single-stranded-DNA-specific exonuclease